MKRTLGSVVPALLSATGDSVPHVRQSAIKALNRLSYLRLGKEIVFKLSPLVADESDPFVRLELVKLLTRVPIFSCEGIPIASQALTLALKNFKNDPLPEVRHGVISWIKADIGVDVSEALFIGLSDPVPKIRMSALFEIRRMLKLSRQRPKNKKKLQEKILELAKNDVVLLVKSNAKSLFEDFDSLFSTFPHRREGFAYSCSK